MLQMWRQPQQDSQTYGCWALHVSPLWSHVQHWTVSQVSTMSNMVVDARARQTFAESGFDSLCRGWQASKAAVARAAAGCLTGSTHKGKASQHRSCGMQQAQLHAVEHAL